MYYLRSRAAADAIKFTVDPTKAAKKVEKENVLKPSNGGPKPTAVPTKKEVSEMSEAEQEAHMAAKLKCSLENKDECLMCGS